MSYQHEVIARAERRKTDWEEVIPGVLIHKSQWDAIPATLNQLFPSPFFDKLRVKYARSFGLTEAP